MKCINCLQNMPEFCLGGECNGQQQETITQSDSSTDSNWRTKKRHSKRRATLKDPLSTGRKEAARLYPLDPEKSCEWLGQKDQGGLKGIDGCPVEELCKQVNRHHGPDKNTLNNEKGNVHLIGFKCHNRWHAKNDEDYVPGQLLSD